MYRNVYVSKQATLTALTRARAAWLWCGGDATLTGLSAAAVLGTKWLDVSEPAELCRVNRHAPSGIIVHSYDLGAREIHTVNGIRITTPERTAFDIARSLPPNGSIPILDALANATNFKIPDVVALADAKPGSRGIRRLPSVLKLVDGGAESPQESRVRLLLISAGLPPPETQIEFTDELGIVRIRVDMGWRDWRVAVEYDGVATLVRSISAVVGYRPDRDARGDGLGHRPRQCGDAFKAASDHRPSRQQAKSSGLPRLAQSVECAGCARHCSDTAMTSCTVDAAVTALSGC